MARGTIKEKRIGVGICDVGLEGGASELGLGASPTFEDRRLGHSDVYGAAVKDVDHAAVADGDVPFFGEFPPLRRYWLAKAGTMLTVFAGSRTLCSSLAIVVAGVGWLLARENIFDDLCPVGMKGSPIMPAWEVQAVSHAADGMDPSRTPTLVCSSVSVDGWGGECG